MTNCDENGIRYSVFSFNELADWCNEDLWYGSQARNLSEEEAVKEINEVAAQEVQWEIDDGKLTEDEREDEIEHRVRVACERLQIDEPVIEGTLDGISYRISWLGGAPLLWIFKGLLGVGEQLCSPCVPGAVDGGGGFLLDSENEEWQAWAERSDGTEFEPTHGYRCHCPPREWVPN